VKWHWNVEVERVIIANTRHEKHHHQNAVISEADFGSDGAELCGENEAMKGDEEKLKECD
jgi:hypothetical protein